jgi:hypothetical protein
MMPVSSLIVFSSWQRSRHGSQYRLLLYYVDFLALTKPKCGAADGRAVSMVRGGRVNRGSGALPLMGTLEFLAIGR